MRKMAVAVVILLAITFLGLWERASIENISERMPQMLLRIEASIKEKDFFKAADELCEIYEAWQEDEKVLDIFISHDRTTEIKLNLLRIERYIKERDEKSAILTIREVGHLIEELEKSTEIKFKNIL